ncbi:MAG: DUF2179 domain-containing protein [Novipirellula sp. JB048]
MMTLLLSAATIFVLRLTDVSLGSLRISMTFRGRRSLAAFFGFFEALTWLAAASIVLGKLEGPIQYLAYAGGFAAGTVLGSTIERWLAIGNTLVRIVTPITAVNVANQLRAQGYYVTTLNAEGRDGDVRVSLTVVPRRVARKLLKQIHQISPESFVTFEETTPIRLVTALASSVRK